jgi:xanthine dehydrogenase YagR molybdenum-binding subunit
MNSTPALEALMQEAAQQPRQPASVPNLPQPPNRYDGRLKVTGKAKYAVEFPAQDVTFAFMVSSTIPAGTITSIDQDAASRAPGVLAVLTPFNAPKLPLQQQDGHRHVSVLQEPTVWYNGQPIAVIVARSLDQARYAATLLKINYAPQPAKLDFTGRLSEARPPHNGNADTKRGDFAASLAQAPTKIDVTYTTPFQFHNPMETHATLASWDGDKLHVYNSTQYIMGDRMTLARTFGISPESVHVQGPLVGGGFGSKGSAWSHVILAAMASRVVGKPVKLAVDRNQMFGTTGGRPTTHQQITLGASPDGKLLAVQHDVILHTSVMEDFVEGSARQSSILYAPESLLADHRLVDMNLGVCTYQRAPGESTGTAAFESALDELAYKLNIDPIQIRLTNYAEKDPSRDHPWTSKHLRECYTQGAERFGWSKRNPRPGQVREGNNLIGMGMATAIYGAGRSNAGATARILPDGTVFIGSATHDMGTGMYTLMAQITGYALGIDPLKVQVKLGDSDLPTAPVAGGSQSTASVTPAVLDAATKLRQKITDLAINDTQSPLHNCPADDVQAKSGRLVSKSSPSKSDSFVDIIRRNGGQPIEVTSSAQPDAAIRNAYSSQSWGAVFAEVAVDVDTHMVKVRRFSGTYDIGTLLNKQTGINQLQGGIVWGISFALHEEALLDPTHGRMVNSSFGEYHIASNADIPSIDVVCLDIPDTLNNPLGARGIGEIGITGVPAAINNAVFNATGKRIRDYPITPDKILLTKSIVS